MQPWVGVAHVKPRWGNALLQGASGAFVSSVALAENGDDFAVALVGILQELQFDVVDITDVRTLEECRYHGSIDATIVDLANSLNAQNRLALGNFHSYEDT